MSTFSVTPEALQTHSARLSGIRPGVDEIRARITGHSGAGADTPASGALSDLGNRLSGILDQFGASTEALHATLTTAGSSYRSTDDGVKTAAQT